MGHLGSASKGLGAFTTDMRKTLDEASESRMPTVSFLESFSLTVQYNLVRPIQKRAIPVPWEPQVITKDEAHGSLDSPLHRQQQIEKVVAEQKIKLALARPGPSIPSRLTPSQDAIVSSAGPVARLIKYRPMTHCTTPSSR